MKHWFVLVYTIFLSDEFLIDFPIEKGNRFNGDLYKNQQHQNYGKKGFHQIFQL
jgi:hypothetical protein